MSLAAACLDPDIAVKHRRGHGARAAPPPDPIDGPGPGRTSAVATSRSRSAAPPPDPGAPGTGPFHPDATRIDLLAGAFIV